MRKNFIFTIISVSLLFLSCGSDDNGGDSPTETTVSELIAAITNNGNTKTWKIESASLTNSNVTNLDVTEAFNIKDDEFLFAANNANSGFTLEHKQRNDFNTNASDFQEFLLDYYKSSLTYELLAATNNVGLFSNTSESLNFMYENNALTGEWSFNASSKLTFTLTEKTAEDYQVAPTSLNFQDITIIPNSFAFLESQGSADVLASQSDNSIFIVYSTDAFENPNGGSNRAEAIIKYNIGTNTFSNNVFHNADFFTKRASITNNEIKVAGTQFLNTYDLNFNSDPTTIGYNDFSQNADSFLLLRHDVVFNNDDLYILGGNSDADLDPNNPQSFLDTVFVYNSNSSLLSESTMMPGAKSQAASELVDNIVYTFSGQRGFSDLDTLETTSYQYSLTNNTFSSFNIPQALNISYTASVENLIYVAGQIFVLNANNNIIDKNAYLGVYNTENGTFTEIQHDLDDSDTDSRISGIAYTNNKLYVVFGNSTGVVEEGETRILAADL